MKRTYPLSLFLIGFVTDLFTRYIYLFIPALLFSIFGIWFEICMKIGFVLLFLDIALSFGNQLMIRHTFLTSDNPNFKPFQDAMTSGGNWMQNFGEVLGENRENQAPEGGEGNEKDMKKGDNIENDNGSDDK